MGRILERWCEDINAGDFKTNWRIQNLMFEQKLRKLWNRNIVNFNVRLIPYVVRLDSSCRCVQRRTVIFRTGQHNKQGVFDIIAPNKHLSFCVGF